MLSAGETIARGQDVGVIGAQDADAISENLLEQRCGTFEITPVPTGFGEGVE